MQGQTDCVEESAPRRILAGEREWARKGAKDARMHELNLTFPKQASARFDFRRMFCRGRHRLNVFHERYCTAVGCAGCSNREYSENFIGDGDRCRTVGDSHRMVEIWVFLKLGMFTKQGCVLPRK